MRWRAVGKKGSEFDGWIYDYSGVLSATWPDGTSGNVPTITGTVTRTVKHGEAKAGSVFSFIAVKRGFVEPRVCIPLKQEVINLMGSLEHRLHHQLWHGARDNWADLSPAKKSLLRDIGWQPGTKNKERNASGDDSLHNGSGEDFLFMHREMIAQMRGIDPIKSWQSLPGKSALASFAKDFTASQVGNPNGFAVPPAWIVPGDPDTTRWLHDLRKTSTFYGRFLVWQAQYTDPAYLSRVTLGGLGSRIESTIHNWMHMRWASVPRDPSTGNPVPEGRGELDFDPKWLKPEYDYLGETFSSHLNPVFWRLHGWVDDRIDDWYKAHEAAHPGEIKRMDKNAVKWFEPGKWVQLAEPWSGPSAHHHGGNNGGVELDIASMKNALKIIFGPEPTTPSLMQFNQEQDGAMPSTRATWFKMGNE